MSIRKQQITRIVETIIKKYLRRGIYPTFQTITYHLSQWLREHTPGAPGFYPIKAIKGETADSKSYNKNVDMIYQDLSNAYEATIQQHEQLIKNFQFIEAERQKLIHDLAQLSHDIDGLLLTTKETDIYYFNQEILSFENMHNWDKEKSTALINLYNQEATLAENQKKSRRLILTNNQVSFAPLGKEKEHHVLESIHHAFDDQLNTAWLHVVKTKQIQPYIKAALTIDLHKAEWINHIEYVPHQQQPIEITLEYTTDGTSFTSIHQQAEIDKTTGARSWTFSPIQATAIRFIMKKTEYDDYSSNLYHYYFGAKRICLYHKYYLNEGYLYTNPIKLEKDTQQISLNSNHEMPFNTEIQYEVAEYQKNKTIEDLIWHPISPLNETQSKHPTILELEKPAIKIIESSTFKETGKQVNGMRVFAMVKDNGSTVLSDDETWEDIQHPILFRGINQWKREKTYRPFNGSVPLNHYWEQYQEQNPNMIEIEYLPFNRILHMGRKGKEKDNFYRFTTCIYSEKKERKEPLRLSVIQQLTSGAKKRLGSYSVYLNQKRLSPINDEVTLVFQEGWNELQLLYHWGDMEERRDFPANWLPTKTTLNKWNLHKEGKVRADLKHLTPIDIHDLFYNVSPNDRNHFALYEQQVLLNYLPKNCIFQLKYESKAKKQKESQILLRARLKRNQESPYMTPKIHKIQLRMR